jgi:hypothetical protein
VTYLIAALGFAGFVILGLIVIIAGGRGEAVSRRWINCFIAYILGVSFLAGISQRDLWPFSYWRLMQRVGPTEVSDSAYAVVQAVAVTSNGDEYPIDYRAWEPFTYEELLTWLMRNVNSLSGPARDSVGAFLLKKTESARLAARAGQWPGVVTRRLRDLAAPSHLLLARRWQNRDDVPNTAFVGIRLYWEHWNVETRARDPAAMRRTILYTFPAQQ